MKASLLLLALLAASGIARAEFRTWKDASGAHEIKAELVSVQNGKVTLKLKSGAEPDIDNIDAILNDLSGNAKKINEHGRRADGIVKSMLLHSRGQSGERQPTDINAMLDEYTNLAYHGMRAQDSTFNITIQRDLAPDAGKIDAIPQDLSRVFLNILNNACYAANERAKKGKLRNAAGVSAASAREAASSRFCCRTARRVIPETAPSKKIIKGRS